LNTIVRFILSILIAVFLWFLCFTIRDTQQDSTSHFITHAEEEVARTKLRDLYSDSWVANDAIGRTLPGYKECGPVKKNKFVGMFYWTWHHTNHGGPRDITKILAKSKKTGSPPEWGPVTSSHHWGEPELGYYVMTDPYVIRKHASMLCDSGVDVIIFDTTNPPFTFREQYFALCKTFSQIRKSGEKTPQIAFITPFGNSEVTVKQLYKEFYSKGLYKDLWFIWKNKPLIMADPANISNNPKISEFFTFRKPVASYFTGPSGPDQWGWLEVYPQHVFKDAQGNAEQMTVGVSQNAVGPDLSMMSHKSGAMGRSWHNGMKDNSKNAVHFGYNFSEQWTRALKINPNFIFVTGWNEWVAGRFIKWYKYTSEKNSYFNDALFVDQFDQEYSRDIEPMKEGHTDTYYYQFVSYVRKYKGVKKQQQASPSQTIRIDGRFSEWKAVTPEFRDTIGDTAHRNFRGYGKTHYTNTTGRNDFILLKAACDKDNIYFYAQTQNPLTSSKDKNWMQLFIDIDQNKKTGWHGYDFLINQNVVDSNITTLKQTKTGWNWKEIGRVKFHTSGNELELAIPRNLISIQSQIKSENTPTTTFDFHWADNIQKPDDIIEFSISGDSAPNRRFDYRYEFLSQQISKPRVPDMLKNYYKTMTEPKPVAIQKEKEFRKHQQNLKQNILDCCGLQPLPDLIPLKIKQSEIIDHPWCTIRRIYYQVWPNVYANGLLFMPKGLNQKPAPAMLCPHGHWPDQNANPIVQTRLLVFAKKGYITFSPMQNHYEDLQLGISHQTIGIWSNMRALDFLESLPEVDKNKIGCCGLSGGGLQTQMLVALDSRVKAAVIGGYTCESREIMFIKGDHCGCNHFPGIMQFTDHPEISTLGLPTPVQYLTMNDWTKNFQKNNFPFIQKLYSANGFPDHVDCHYESTKHTYNKSKREQTYWWMDKWIRGKNISKPESEPEGIATIPVKSLSSLSTEVPGNKGFSEISNIYAGNTKWKQDPSEMKQLLGKLLGEKAVLPVKTEIIEGRPLRFSEDLVIEHAYYPSEGMISIPAVILRSINSKGKLPIIILCDGRGKDKALSEQHNKPAATSTNKIQSAIESARNGSIVVIPDVRFTGVFSRENLLKHQIGMWHRNSIVWGRPLPAMACTDIIGVLNGIATRSDCDMSNIKLICRNSKSLSIAGLFAAILDKRITATDLDLQNCSFKDKDIPVIPFILRYGDVDKWKSLLKKQH